MSDPTPSNADARFEEAETWPWQCLDCGTTIYQDGEFCRVCASAHRLGGSHRVSNSSNGFIDWMRDQSLPTFVLKTTAVAGIELALTALWLQLALFGLLELGTPLSIVG